MKRFFNVGLVEMETKMIDETNIQDYLLEPSGKLQFRTLELLIQHVEKHVFKEAEKWGKLKEFQVEDIRLARRGNEAMKRTIGLKYQKFLSDKMVEYCRIGWNHRHFFYFVNTPEEMDGAPDREPEQIVKCWGILENLVIVASSIVRNDTFAPYILKTGYRTYPKLKKKSWLKRELSHADEMGDFFEGKRCILIADHME